MDQLEGIKNAVQPCGKFKAGAWVGKKNTRKGASPTQEEPQDKLGGPRRGKKALAKERVGRLPWLQEPGEERQGSNGRVNQGRGEATGRPGQGSEQDGERK